MQAHDDVVRNVQEMGTQLMRRIEDARERERLAERLSHVNIRWRHLCGLADAIKTRLLNAEEEWEKLLTQLSDNLFWAEAQSHALLEEQPVGGLLTRVQEQSNFIEVIFYCCNSTFQGDNLIGHDLKGLPKGMSPRSKISHANINFAQKIVLL